MKKITKRHIQYHIPVFCIILLCIAGILNIINKNIYPAIIEIWAAVAVAAFVFMLSKSRAKEIEEYMSIIAEQAGNASNEVLSRFPLPMFILSIDGKIVWYNDSAISVFDDNNLYDKSIIDLLPQLKWSQVLKSTDSINVDIEHNGKYYNVWGNIVKRKKENKETYTVLLYFLDRTETVNSIKLREDEKVDIAIITVDNYDDIFQTIDDSIVQETLGKINSIISKWVAESNGVMKKIHSDRYMVFFEHQYLEGYIKNKFDILEKVRAVGDEIKEPITISIGIGTGGHLTENESFARSSVEMVWGRGGDQVAIKDSTNQFKFYGGTSKDYEKSTRVKTRIFSNALKEMIKQADKVIFMGHKGADYDSLGSAIGLSKAVRLLGKPAYIVLDNSPAIKPVYDEMSKLPEFQGIVISPNDAVETASEETMVIVLDTHKPSMLPVPELINAVHKIVLIDHHRRSTEFIENLSLSYLEPYASSTCEMVTEILQYIDDKKSLSNFEAKALYIGMLMDTKNFVSKTGVRTFEAASYLKRYGVNTMDVKKLFNLSFEEYVKRMEIIKRTEIWNSDIAVSVCFESFNNMRVVSSQAADEMLNISGIKAAFVIYPNDGDVFLSARSFGDVNVQIIMEKLGGGGHMTIAGCQIKNTTVSESREKLKEAIKEYIEESK